MITLSIRDNKLKKGIQEVYDSLDKASARLQVIGSIPRKGEKIDPRKRYILEGASWDTDFEKALLEPYLFPDKKD